MSRGREWMVLNVDGRDRPLPGECGARGFAQMEGHPWTGCVRRKGHPGGHGYADGSGEQDEPAESPLAGAVRRVAQEEVAAAVGPDPVSVSATFHGSAAGLLAVLGLFCVARGMLACALCGDDPQGRSRIDVAEPSLTLLHVMALAHMRDVHPGVSSVAAEVLGS